MSGQVCSIIVRAKHFVHNTRLYELYAEIDKRNSVIGSQQLTGLCHPKIRSESCSKSGLVITIKTRELAALLHLNLKGKGITQYKVTRYLRSKYFDFPIQ